MQLRIFLLLLTVVCSCHARIVETFLGPVEENNPVVLKLLDSKAIQRLKLIDQSGPTAYFLKNFRRFSRYDHSLGVYALLKRYNASQEEQIAGLLHDASHTAFSHIGDWIFSNRGTKNPFIPR
jgi:HD superfamily phosphohydrolase